MIIKKTTSPQPLSSQVGGEGLIVNSDEIISAARGCLGTGFHHQGRQCGVGLDCIGLVVVALGAVGIMVRDRSDYGLRPDGLSLVEAIVGHGAFIVNDIRPADLLLFRYDNQPQHVAIATRRDAMIHSFASAGEVVETVIGGYWRRRLVGVYRFPFVVGV